MPLRREMLFPTRSVREDDGQFRKHNTIQCSHCPQETTARNSTDAGGLGDEMLTRKFTRLGWYVSRSPGGHLCPDCNPTKQRAIIVPATPDGPTLTVVPKTQEEPVSKPTPASTETRELSFSDRRIINAKLEEVYENETTGYLAGWDDDGVAKDLGVNVVWVVKLRSENFGPATGNARVREIVAEYDALRQRVDEAERCVALAKKVLITFQANAGIAGISLPQVG